MLLVNKNTAWAIGVNGFEQPVQPTDFPDSELIQCVNLT